MRFRILIMLIIIIPTLIFSDAVSIAEDYRDLMWYVFNVNITWNYSPSGDPQLGYTDNHPCDWTNNIGEYLYGMPFHYGGRDSFDQWFDDYTIGYNGPGAHDVHHPGSLTWAAGIDCSGLVGRCWEVDEYTLNWLFDCTYIADTYPPVTQEQLSPGDCFTLPGDDGHCMLFISWSGSYNVNVIEAVAIDLNYIERNKVYQNTYSISYLLNLGYLMRSKTGTGIEEIIVEPVKLLANHPNPFNPSTTISYSLMENTQNPQIEIYNVKGQKVKGYQLEEKPGESSIVWNGKDTNDKPVSSGVYFYRLVNEGKIMQTRKMLLMK